MRCSLLVIVVLALSASASAQVQPFKLNLLTTSAKFSGAVCLDGSPSAYYLRPGTNTNKWLIFFQGGGWCTDLEDCYARSKTRLGSSKSYPATINIQSGYFSPYQTQNPMMYDWNMVHVQYCDGGSFSGRNETVTPYKDTALYFRGHRILKAVMYDLLLKHKLGKATDVVISGCSAGGLATYLHADEIRSMLPKQTTVAAMPDSGFFLDYNGPPKYGERMRWVFEQNNATDGVNADCVKANPGNESNCMFAEHTAPHIQTPLFALQSRFDAWQIPNVLGSNETADIQEFGLDLTQRITRNLIASSPKHSMFLDSCRHHCGNVWTTIHDAKHTQASAFDAWYGDGFGHSPVFQSEPYPCVECCQR